MSPGRRELSFLPIAFRPCPRAFVPALSPFVAARASALRTIPTARQVQPYFLKMFLIRSRKGRASSLSWICGSNLSISSSLSMIRSVAACLSLEVAFALIYYFTVCFVFTPECFVTFLQLVEGFCSVKT